MSFYSRTSKRMQIWTKDKLTNKMTAQSLAKAVKLQCHFAIERKVTRLQGDHS